VERSPIDERGGKHQARQCNIRLEIARRHLDVEHDPELTAVTGEPLSDRYAEERLFAGGRRHWRIFEESARGIRASVTSVQQFSLTAPRTIGSWSIRNSRLIGLSNRPEGLQFRSYSPNELQTKL
jgi:hypothetical protein